MFCVWKCKWIVGKSEGVGKWGWGKMVGWEGGGVFGGGGVEGCGYWVVKKGGKREKDVWVWRV